MIKKKQLLGSKEQVMRDNWESFHGPVALRLLTGLGLKTVNHCGESRKSHNKFCIYRNRSKVAESLRL